MLGLGAACAGINDEELPFTARRESVYLEVWAKSDASLAGDLAIGHRDTAKVFGNVRAGGAVSNEAEPLDKLERDASDRAERHCLRLSSFHDPSIKLSNVFCEHLSQILFEDQVTQPPIQRYREVLGRALRKSPLDDLYEMDGKHIVLRSLLSQLDV